MYLCTGIFLATFTESCVGRRKETLVNVVCACFRNLHTTVLHKSYDQIQFTGLQGHTVGKTYAHFEAHLGGQQ